MPLPPTEMKQLQRSNISTRIEWDSGIISNQSSVVKTMASLGSELNTAAVAAVSQDDGLASELDDVETFRRVHLLPYDGDALEALIKIGRRVRKLLMEYSGTPPADLTRFRERYKSIIADLDVLSERNISPLVEISKRARRSGISTKMSLEAYILRTAQILSSAPYAIAPQQADGIIHWLRGMRARSTVPVFGHPEKVILSVEALFIKFR